MNDREIDAKVAEMMGCKPKKIIRKVGFTDTEIEDYACRCISDEHNESDDCKPDVLKHYTADISAAWQVVEKIREEYGFAIRELFGVYEVVIVERKNIKNTIESASADTAPMAICLAALKAKGVEVK